jgi:hypothetical protein
MDQQRTGRTVPGAEVSRRSVLAQGGVVAAGGAAAVVGAAAIGAAAYGEPLARADEPAQTAYDVKSFGAVGDGETDDTGSIQQAIGAARAGGGIVFFPPGTYLTRRLTLYSQIHLRGSGGDATILRLKPGANSAILESDGFADLTGTRTSGGITMFSVRDLTLDGNRGHNPTRGYGLRIYGYGYELTEVVVFNCHDDGIFSEWGLAGALPFPSHQMEARLSSIRSHDNDGHGFNFNGPHDSMFLNCVAFQNRATGFRLDADSSGTSLVSCRGWGAPQGIGFDLAAPGIGCVNCHADLGGGVGVRISRNDCRWVGGAVLGHNRPPPAQEIGIQFTPGLEPNEPAGVVVDTKILNCGTAAVDFIGERGLSSVRAAISQPGVPGSQGTPIPGTGRGWVGTPHPTTQVEITDGIGDTPNNLVIRPAFDLRAQPAQASQEAETVRLFAGESGGRTQLCARFPDGTVRVLATDV